MSIPRNVSVSAWAAGLGLLAFATWSDPGEAPSPGHLVDAPSAAHAPHGVEPARPVAASPLETARESAVRDEELSLPVQPLPGDLVVAVEAPPDQRCGIPFVLTRTGRDGSTERLLDLASDEQAQATVLRQFLQPRDDGGVLCVDFAFPTLGEHAVQVDAATARAEFLLPERGALSIDVLEADGVPLRTAALAEVRVLGATPPADRRHACELVGGTARLTVAATSLQLEVAVTLLDGRRLEPMTVRGPASAELVAPCVFRLPPRPSFTARLSAADGAPLADAAIAVWLEQAPARLDAPPRTDAKGRITFAAPVQPGAQPLPVLFVVHSDDGRSWFARRDVELHEFAPADLGVLSVQPCQLLAAGRCVDARGQPAAGVAVFAQTETTFDARRRPGARGGWRDLASAAVRTDADGRFQLLGPPQSGRRLRLSVRGEPRLVVPFVEGAPEVAVPLPNRRNRTLP